MSRIPVPPDVPIYVELGTDAPAETAYNAFGPFEIAWVITNGTLQRVFLWVASRKTGIYVAFGGPHNIHTSYHADGRFHLKSDTFEQEFPRRAPPANLSEPVLIQDGSFIISNEILEQFNLAEFRDRRVDRVIFMDNRILPEALLYHVWAVPPFKHGDVPLMTDHPAHIHISTHTNPWIEVVIYEKGTRK